MNDLSVMDRMVLPGGVRNGIIEAVGGTPMIRLQRYLDVSSIELLVKLESLNPGGSAKDRPARQMIEDGLQSGLIGKDSVIVESSSGNMGIGMAQVCRYYGLRFVCVVDPNAQAQNIAIMRALGAELQVVSQPVNGDFLAARLAAVQTLLASIPQSVWPNQYANLSNPKAHENGTIAEIDATLDGDFDYLFVATSSTGTARGCRDYLRTRERTVRLIAVDAQGSTLFNGKAGPRRISGMGAGKTPPLANGQSFDGLIRVSDARCVAGCRRAARQEALLVGGSAGGVLEAIRLMTPELAGKKVVAILHDSGVRYLETIFNDEWVEAKLGVDASQLRNFQSQTGSQIDGAYRIAWP